MFEPGESMEVTISLCQKQALEIFASSQHPSFRRRWPKEMSLVLASRGHCVNSNRYGCLKCSASLV